MLLDATLDVQGTWLKAVWISVKEPRNQVSQAMQVLYITYDGLMEPLGQSQVFGYLGKLARQHDITLVSYEKAKDWADKPRREALAKEVRSAGIRWIALRYHRRPTLLATSYDLAHGFVVCALLVLRFRIRIVHARSYVPAVLALALKRIFATRFVFDMRGFWADEKVDGGAWPVGCRLYRWTKCFEKAFLTGADVVVSLTHAGVAEMRKFDYLAAKEPRYVVIPTCADLELFKPLASAPAVRPQGAPFVLGCVGSVGLWYLFEPMLECFKTLCRLRPDSRFLILNRDDHMLIRERLRANAIPAQLVELKSVNFDQVAGEMSRMDAAIFFIKPVFSKKGSAPTKLGELLGCGVPCLSNAGVGDYERILEGDGAGVVLRDFGADEMMTATKRLLEMAADPQVRSRCVDAAHQHFSLLRGVESYDRIYQSFAERQIT